MKLVQAIIFAFIAAYICGDFGVPMPFDVLAVLTAAALGYVLRDEQDRYDQARAAQAALARDQRNARLIADATAERTARQELGEFTT